MGDLSGPASEPIKIDETHSGRKEKINIRIKKMNVCSGIIGKHYEVVKGTIHIEFNI